MRILKILMMGLVFMFLATGCAKKYPLVRLEPTGNATEKIDFSKYSVLKVEVLKAEGVEMTDEDLKRMNDLIIKAFQEQYKGKFQVVGNDTSNVSNELVLEVKFVKFQKAKQGWLPTFHPQVSDIRADIFLKAGNAIFTSKVCAYGDWNIYGGDIPAYERDILGAAARRWGVHLGILSLQNENEKAFAKKIIKTLRETFPETF